MILHLALLAIPFLQAPALAPRDTVTVHADNPPIWGAHPVLKEELRIGALEGDEHDTFGTVTGLTTTPDGTVWVSDNTLKTLRRYGSDGTFLGDVGRSGNGPGEFNYILSARTLSDGSVAVWDPLNNHIHVFSGAGEFERDIRVDVPGMIYLPQNFEVDRMGRMYAVSLDLPKSRSGGPIHAYWIRVDADGVVLDTVDYRPGHQEGRYHPIRSVTAVSPLGYRMWGRNDDYAFFRPLPDGRLERLVRDWTPVRYARSERAESQDMEDVFAERNAESPRRIPRTKPAWSGFQVDSDGRLWVQRYTRGVQVNETPEIATRRRQFDNPQRHWGEPQTYDVVEPDGRFLGTLQFPGTATASVVPRVQIMLAEGTTVWTVELGEYDEAYIVRYRIIPGD